MAPMFVEVSVAFVEPRGQYHNFLIRLDGATWMASTVFFEARLAICLRVKLSCVSGAIAAHVTIPLPWSHAARSRRKSQLSYKYYIDYIYFFFQDICSGRLPRIHHFTSDTNRLEWKERIRTALVPFQPFQQGRKKLKRTLTDLGCPALTTTVTYILAHL